MNSKEMINEYNAVLDIFKEKWWNSQRECFIEDEEFDKEFAAFELGWNLALKSGTFENIKELTKQKLERIEIIKKVVKEVCSDKTKSF